MCSPHLSKLNEPELLDSSVPFGESRAADVVACPNHHGKVDGSIDDLMSVGWLSAAWKRLAVAVLLTIHIFGRPVAPNEPISRDDLLSMTKLISEGTPREIKFFWVSSLTYEDPQLDCPTKNLNPGHFRLNTS